LYHPHLEREQFGNSLELGDAVAGAQCPMVADT
jgi:hypothetical protein